MSTISATHSQTRDTANQLHDTAAVLQAPRLGHRALSVILIIMCLVPVITIYCLWQFLPPVYEGQLEAAVSAEQLPPADFYMVDYHKRPPYDAGILVISNLSEQDWTHLNIQVNKHYQIYDVAPIGAGETRKFELNRFLSRTGARFSVRYNQLKSVRIYARRPSRDRATFYHEFETVPENE